MLTLTLPIAPPANNAFVNRTRGRFGFGRIKSAKYKAWLKSADAHYMVQKKDIVPVRGPYLCGMIFPNKMRGDLDGRAKLILDWMVSREITSDDKHLTSLHLVRDNTPKGYVIIQVREEANAGSQLPSAAALTERAQS